MLHEIKINKSHRSMQVTLPALLGNYDGQTNQTEGHESSEGSYTYNNAYYRFLQYIQNYLYVQKNVHMYIYLLT